uniref:Uncharacterized protein n=1 Tax=Romanomermis culicivorax TaxID=13658 RepID=A0A915IBD7_ROMCU
MTTKNVQMQSVISQQPPVAVATNSPTMVANAFGEMLHAINDDVSIIEASPFPSATAPQSLKVHPAPQENPETSLGYALGVQQPIKPGKVREKVVRGKTGKLFLSHDRPTLHFKSPKPQNFPCASHHQSTGSEPGHFC